MYPDSLILDSYICPLFSECRSVPFENWCFTDCFPGFPQNELSRRPFAEYRNMSFCRRPSILFPNFPQLSSLASMGKKCKTKNFCFVHSHRFYKGEYERGIVDDVDFNHARGLSCSCLLHPASHLTLRFGTRQIF